jgi:tetratricopeptide (TPR) repeat protein
MRFFQSPIIVVLLLTASQLSAQQTRVTDSLQHILSGKIPKEERVKISLSLSELFTTNNPLLALEYAEESIQLAAEIGNDSLRFRGYVNQANAYLVSGNYARALQSYQVVIPGAEKNGDSVALSITYGNMGSIYYYQHDFERALNYDLRSLSHFSPNAKDKKTNAD